MILILSFFDFLFYYSMGDNILSLFYIALLSILKFWIAQVACSLPFPIGKSVEFYGKDDFHD